MIVVTGASGALGRLVVETLLERVAPSEIVAAVRSPAKVTDLARRGVQVREADYSRQETLATAFAGATKVLLISSPSIGARVGEHRAVIDATKAAGVEFIAYTSVLRADTSTLLVAPDHIATERYLEASGVPWVMLRNGWYHENRTAALGAAVTEGVVVGSAGHGRIAAAARKDYAEAAAVVLTTSGHDEKIYELGGDNPFTLAELAAEVSRHSGKLITYNDLPERAFASLFEGAGLPPHVANLVADSDTKAQRGELDTTSRDLSRLIKHSTTSLAAAVAAALG